MEALAAATASDALGGDVYIPDTDLINDLGGTGEALAAAEVTPMDIYHQQVVTNQLLGVILALLVIWSIYGIGRTLYQLVSYHIFRHF